MASNQEEWNPSKPLDDKEAEEEAQARAKARARVDFLTDELKKKNAPPRKKGIFD